MLTFSMLLSDPCVSRCYRTGSKKSSVGGHAPSWPRKPIHSAPEVQHYLNATLPAQETSESRIEDSGETGLTQRR